MSTIQISRALNCVFLLTCRVTSNSLLHSILMQTQTSSSALHQSGMSPRQVSGTHMIIGCACMCCTEQVRDGAVPGDPSPEGQDKARGVCCHIWSGYVRARGHGYAVTCCAHDMYVGKERLGEIMQESPAVARELTASFLSQYMKWP